MAPRFALEAGDRPRAVPVARLQAEKGLRVTNARHEMLNVDEFMRQLLRHLDGTRDRAALLDVLAELAAQGRLTIREEGKLVTKPEAVREIVGLALDQNLPKLARAALLEA
jgi:methyltransferase-like protein